MSGRHKYASCKLCLALAIVMASQAPATEPATSTALRDHRFHQVAIRTEDLPRAIAFYRDRLGLSFLFESNGLVFFDVGGTRLLIERQTDENRGRPGAILYFDAPDFEKTASDLRAAGVRFKGPAQVVQRAPSGDLHLLEFEDPDGNMLAIMGTVPR